MNTNTGPLTVADFEDIGLALAPHRHEGLDVEPMTEADVWHCPPTPLAWKCNQGRGPEEHVSRVPPSWFGRPGRGPVGDIEPRDSFPSAALRFWAAYGIAIVAVIAGISWAVK